MNRMQNQLLLCALMALLTALCGVVQAQGMTATPGGMGMSGAMDTMGGAMDYQLLNNPFYDYVDLKQARALGYSDGEIAVIAKIARMTGLSFKTILNQVHEGRTFAWLASDYNLRLVDVLDASDEQARIEQYLRAYESLNSLGTEHFAALSTAQTISGPTLAELEARFNQLNAQFPALPPTNIETTPIGSGTTEVETPPAPAPPVVVPPPPVETPAPTPPAPVARAKPAPPRPAARRTTRRVTRTRTRRTTVRRTRRVLPTYMRRGS